MTASTAHPDFAAADQEHRWARSLTELGTFLREAAWKAKGSWVWRILPQGACVAMRVNPPSADRTTNLRKELRLSRRGIKKPDPALWMAEVKTFLGYLDCATWVGGVEVELVREPDAETYQVSTSFLEPAAFGAKPEFCARCGKQPAEKGPYKEALCNQCATELGTAEAAAHKAAR